MTIFAFRRSAWYVGTLLLANAAWAQTPTAVPTKPVANVADHGADIRIDTHLVEVDVVVRDHNGPVKGLTKDDFTVLDNGKPQRISAFSVKTGHDSVGLQKLPEGAVSNRINALGEAPGAVTVILWDVLNTEFEDQAWVRGEVVKYLKTLRPGDRVALYRLVKNLRVIQDFTDNPDRLAQAVKGTAAEQSTSLSAADLTSEAGTVPVLDPSQAENIADLNASQMSAALELQYYSVRDRALITLDAFQAIAQHLGGLPDRKKIVWVTGSFPALSDIQNSRNRSTQLETLSLGYQIQKTVEALNHANVAVYPVDARGITVSNQQSTGLTGALAAGSQGGGGLNNVGVDTMNLLARGTGGKAYYGTNDIGSAVREIIDDSEITYTLAFAPPTEIRQGKFNKDGTRKPDTSYHSIAVKVDRKGIDVRHRLGYRTSDEVSPSDPQRIAELTGAVRNELDATGLAITAITKPVADKPGLYDVELNLDIHDLNFQQQQDSKNMPHWLALIDFATLLSDQQRPIGSYEAIWINLTEPRLRESLENGFVFHREIAYTGPEKKLRLVIQDHATGRNGSVAIPLVTSK